MARPSKYYTDVEPKLNLIGAWARDGLTNEQIATNLGISNSTFYEYQKEFREFSDTLKTNKEVIDIQVENALLKRALGYEFQETIEELMVDETQKKRHHNKNATFTEKDWDFCKLYFNYKCCYCGEGKELTKDHLIPFTKEGEFSKTNIIPCCKSCNSSKNNNNLDEWYKKQPFYNEYRLNKIYDYITLMENKIEQEDLGLKVVRRITKTQPGDVTAQIFWLKNRKPSQWRDKQEIESKNENINTNKNIDMSGLSTDELRKLIDEEDEEI